MSLQPTDAKPTIHVKSFSLFVERSSRNVDFGFMKYLICQQIE